MAGKQAAELIHKVRFDMLGQYIQLKRCMHYYYRLRFSISKTGELTG